MSSSSTITVPPGMSCVNAFHALWNNSKPAIFLQGRPEIESAQAETVSSADKVAELFKSQTFFDYEGGRLLKTDFSDFPTLQARLYDRDYGAGAAQKVIEQYNNIVPSERFDKNDSYKFEELTKK